ncbi:MAG TPA: hypothetical protein VK427_22175 [Kofleriaceae bacterium]|nr:hypothetical protein [Kofleriaceae bacterium]
MKRIVLAFVLAACSEKSAKQADTGPSCAEVTDNMLKIMQAQYPGHGDMGAMGNREQTIQQCEVRKMPASEKRCIVAAKTVEDLGACRRASIPKAPGSAAAGSAK